MVAHFIFLTNVLMEAVWVTLEIVKLQLCVPLTKKHVKMALACKRIKIVSIRLAVCKKAELSNVQMENALILN